MGLKITKGVSTASVVEVVEFSIWVEGEDRLCAQIRGGKKYVVKVKQNNWLAANGYIQNIPEIKQFIYELKRGLR